mmetsp:Transcript_90983/g.167043  ORF Transcript_90983/g.167043 Transcript_90983/m.167043 type:complete len:794 (+) Transcript_90983:82-2463(+)
MQQILFALSCLAHFRHGWSVQNQRGQSESSSFAETPAPLKLLGFVQSTSLLKKKIIAEVNALALLLLAFNLQAAFNHGSSTPRSFVPGLAVSNPMALNRHRHPTIGQGTPAMGIGAILEAMAPVEVPAEVQAKLRAEAEPKRWALGNDLGGKLYVVGEAGPLVAVCKPRGLAIPGGHPLRTASSIVTRLAKERGGTWAILRRFFTLSAEWGIAVLTEMSNLTLAEEATRNAPLELWFEVVVFTGIDGASVLDSTSLELPLPTIASVATIHKLKEEGRAALLSVRLELREGNTTTREAADALTAALADLSVPVAGSMSGCRKVKRSSWRGKGKYRLLSLVRLRCGELDTKAMLTPVPFTHALHDERKYVEAEAKRQKEVMPKLIGLLTGPAAANHSQYAPELQELQLRRLGATSEDARATLDALQLPAPSDTDWLHHASAVLDRQLMEDWKSKPEERARLQYARQVSWLLSCFVRVQRNGHSPVEWFIQGDKVWRPKRVYRKKKEATEKEIEDAVSIASVGIELAVMQSPVNFKRQLKDLQVAVVGAGRVAREILINLQGNDLTRVVLLSHSPNRNKKLAEEFTELNIETKPMEELWPTIEKMDLVLTATDVSDPLVTDPPITKDELNARVWGDGDRPLMLMDFAVPRSIEAACGELPNVFSYTVEDLRELVDADQEKLNMTKEDGEAQLSDEDEMCGPLRATPLLEGIDDRGKHGELMALNKAFALCQEESPSGEGCIVEMMISHYPCVSCAAAMRCFAARLPNVQLRVAFRDWCSMQRTLNAALLKRPPEET